MKKRMMALLMAMLILGQMLPLSALAEEWSQAVSNEVRGAEYVTVTFEYPVYQETEDGGETIGGYQTIVTQMVEKGKTAVQPHIPNIAGHAFVNWTDEQGTILDVNTPVDKDTTFRAVYRKLETRTVTINYVFDIDGSMAQEPYVAEFEYGSPVDITVESPKMQGFVAQQETVEVKIDSITDDFVQEVRYTGEPTYYTVKYHFQNTTDNGYTEGGFERAAVHGHNVGGDDFGGTGWITVGPYTIKEYPEGTSQAGKPVIAGGMTEVRNMPIEGFVQQDIVQRRVMPGGTTVVDVYYDREVYTYTVDNDGGTAVDSRALRYGAPLGLPDPSTMQRPGYTFDGFYSKNYAWQNGTWVEVSGEQKHDSSCEMPPYDFTIKVRWTPVQTAHYKVVYWVQSVKDAYNATDADKTYDYLSAESFVGTVGNFPTVDDVMPQDQGLSSTFFALNSNRSEIKDIQDTWNSSYATSNKEIKNDGSTVINVYFDRQTVEFEFGYSQGRQWIQIPEYSRIGLYGQNWREAGYGTDGWPGGRWTDENGLGEGNWTYLDGFNHEDLTSTKIRFTRNTSDGSKDIYQYIEALDSTPENRKWIEADHYEQGSGDFNLTSKFLPGFTLYGYRIDNAQSIQTASSGSVSYDNRLDVYSTRNTFTLTYANCADGSMDGARTQYKYEEPLQEPVGYTPKRPENVEADHVFAGWYLDEGFQVPVPWGEHTMPAANMVIYAKWAPPTFTVTYHDVRTNTVDDKKTETTYAFKVEKFASLAGREDVEEQIDSNYKLHETTYVDTTDRLTYTFRGWYLDETYTVPWEPSTTISADKDVYAKWEPSGTVWYRYVFLGMYDGQSTELGKWPEQAFEETVWPQRPYGEFAEASKDFGKAGLTDFPAFEGWRPMSTLSTTRERLTAQYQEIPVYYVPTSTWPLTIHYVDENGSAIIPDELHDLTEAIKVYDYKKVDGYKLTGKPQLTARRDMEPGADGRVHITFEYVAVRPLPYTVEYYFEQLDGSYAIDSSETVNYTVDTSKWSLGETAVLQTGDEKTFTGFTYNADHADAVSRVILQEAPNEDKNVLRLYYDRNSYEVTYQYNGIVPADAPTPPVKKEYMFEQEVSVEPDPTLPGYTFYGWDDSGSLVNADTATFRMPASKVELWGNWVADNDTQYIIQFYYMDENGRYPSQADREEKHGGTTGATAEVTDADKQDEIINGLLYRWDEGYADEVLSGTITADPTLVLKLYFKRVMAEYTVHHYLTGTTTSVAADQTTSAQVGSSVRADAAAQDQLLEGFKGAQARSAVPANAVITIVENGANVITRYYSMPLTLRANDASKTYDGAWLREGGFTVVNPENLVLGHTQERFTLAMTSASQIRNPGTVDNIIDGTTIELDGAPVPGYYEITRQSGKLTVYSRLTVTKTVTPPEEALAGETGSALEIPTFQFLLKNAGGTAPGNVTYTVDGGAATALGADGGFSLQAGQTARFNGLTAGTYTVQEVYNADWRPEGNLAQSATIAASGDVDVTVTFNNKRANLEDVTLRKVWVDGNGTAANRPDTLDFTLLGKAGEDEVYRAPVTLKAADGWTITVNGLPQSKGGKDIVYSLVEDNVPQGYTEAYSPDGKTVTNTVTQRELTITGTKTWLDGGRTHNNAKDVTLTLQRRTNGGPWGDFNPGAGNFQWNGDVYAFSKLPAYDANGYAYEYRVVETTQITHTKYTAAYTPSDGVAKFDAAGTATVDITNAIEDTNTCYVYGFKTWVDGGLAHNNAQELTLSLQRRSQKPGADWEDVTQATDEGGYRFDWSADKPNQYGFADLEWYDPDGYLYLYRVRETINDPTAAAAYEITYSPADGETKEGEISQVDITNTLKDRQPTKPEKSADDVSKAGVQAGDEITYTIRRASHLITATTATVTDKLPEGLKFVRTVSVKVGDHSGEKDAKYDMKLVGNTSEWIVRNVPPLGYVEVVFVAKVTEQALSVIENHATVELDGEDDAAFTGDTEEVAVARMSLTKTAKLPQGKTKAAPGDAIEYVITMRNTGAVQLLDGVITDGMLERAEAGSIRLNGSPVQAQNNAIRLTQPMDENDEAVVTYRVIVNERDIVRGAVDNTAVGSVTLPANKGQLTREAATHTPTELKNGHLTVTKQTVSQPKDKAGYAAGEAIQYKIVVTNDGNLTITNISVQDSLSQAKGQVIGTIERLAPGQSQTFSFEYVVTEADIARGKVKNQATAAGTSPDPDKPQVPVQPGHTEDKTVPRTQTSDSDETNEADTLSIGVGYASVNVGDCCE